jgi:diamine N-acetyltransferase
MSEITLRELTKENLGDVMKLVVAEDQERFVAPNTVSVAQAYVHENAWPRAVYSGDELVGFVMLSIDREKAEYWIWRLMIGERHQRRGYGSATVRAVIDHVRRLPNATELKLSFTDGPGNPSPVYAALGFELTGEMEDGEEVMRLAL